MNVTQTHGRSFSVTLKLQSLVFAIVLLIIGVQTVLNISNAKQRNETETKQNLASLHNEFNQEIKILEKTAASLALTFAHQPDIQERFQAQDRPAMLALLEPVFKTLKTDYNIVHLQFHEPSGHIFLRIHDPEEYGDYTFTYRRANALAIISRQTVTGIEIDPNRMGIQGISPVFYQGQFVGLVEVGLDYDQAFLEDFKARHGADYKMWVLHKDAAVAGLGPVAGAPQSPSPEFFYYAGTNPADLGIPLEVYDSVLRDGESQVQFVSADNQEFAVLVAPMLGYGDRIIGILEISISRAEALTALQNSQRTTLTVAGGLALLALILMWGSTNLVVLRPLRHLTAVAQRQLKGDLVARVELLPADEFGQLGHTLNILTETLDNTLQGQEGIIAERTAQLQQELTTRKQIEHSLREREALYRALFDQWHDAVFILSLEGQHLTTNQRAIEMLGYTEAEIQELSYLDFSAEPAESTQIMARLLNGESIPSFERIFKKKSGEHFPVEINAELVRDTEGRPLHIQSVVRDITERKQAEEALQESEARYRAIVEDQTEFIVRWQPDGVRTFVNEAYCRYFEQTREELIGTSFFSLIAEEFQEAVRARLNALSIENPASTDEHQVIRPDGTIGWQQWTDRAIFDDGGKIVEFQSVGRDITERKQTEEEVRHRNRELALLNRIIAASATDLEVDSILETVCHELGRAFDVPIATVFLFSEDKTQAIVRAEYLTEDQPSTLNDVLLIKDVPLAQALLNQKTLLIVNDPNNDPRLGSRLEIVRHRNINTIILVPLITGEDMVGILAFAFVEPRDFSAEEIDLIQNVANQVAGVLARVRLAEQHQQLEAQYHQAQKMEAVGLLAGGIAHDFNNLLTSINGFAELIRQQLEPDDPLKEMVDTVLGSGQRAAELTRQLLIFSRKQVAEPEILNLNIVVTEMDKMLRRTIGEHIEMETILTPDVWPVKIDPTQMEQVIVNLAVNARDAMPNGGRLLIETSNVVLDDDFLDTHIDIQPGDYVLLTITDNGYGMSEAVKAHIFEPFFTTKELGKGTGLGLATVFGIIQQNGGTILVYSEEGVGTTFKIYLPHEAGPVPTRQHIREKADLPVGNETILLVEDDAGVRRLAEQVLQQQGYTLLVGQNGQEALQWAEQYAGSIDLLLTDIVMPGMNGKDLAEQLAQQQPNLAVLFMSGYADRMVARDVLRAKDIFLQKPFGPSSLAHKVRAVLDRKTDRQLQPFEHDADLQGTLTAADLADLPIEWLADLHDAARRGKDELIVELLEQLDPEHALLARTITQLAHNFRFDEIVVLTKRPNR